MKYFLSILFFVICIYFLTPIKNVNALDKIKIDEIAKGCGTIGLSCCKPIKFEPFRIGYLDIPLVEFVINPLIDYANSILSTIDTATDYVAKLIQDNVRGNAPCAQGRPSSNDPNNCSCLPRETFDVAKLCLNISRPAEKTACINCSKRGIWTSLGCVDFKLESFVKEIAFGLGLGLAGVVSLLCIIYSAFMLQTSGGNPERIKKAQEMLTSCIMGLMLIIFSIFILRLIGVNILKIPGFR